jgi:hypothetical protein
MATITAVQRILLRMAAPPSSDMFEAKTANFGCHQDAVQSRFFGPQSILPALRDTGGQQAITDLPAL